MPFTIDLYNISKRPNSTAQPDSSNTTGGHKVYSDCYAKDETSVISPVIVIRDSIATLCRYNYAYISDWKRYYFITDIVLQTGGLCELHLRADVLASFRYQIGSSYQYVLRSASSYDGKIIDHFYPTKTETDFDFKPLRVTSGGVNYDCRDVVTNTYILKYFRTTIAEGDFVIGVIGDNDTGITYYALNYTNFKALLTNLMSYTPSDMNDVSTGIAKVLADPMQFITTCFWIPYAGFVSQTARTIKFGYYSVSCTAGVLNASDYACFQTYADLPKHPQAASRGDYLNAEPFSSYSLLFNPFGELKLDAMKLITDTKIRIEWYYDCTKGNAEIFVFGDDSGEIAYHGYSDMLGVPIQLSQMTVNTIQTGASVMDAIGGFFTMNVADIFRSVGNAVESQMPKVSKHGAEGSFLNYRSMTPRVRGEFVKVVDEDLQDNGRPLCKRVRINTLSGYLQCGNAEISIQNALEEEGNQIVSLLNEGIFYE